MSTRKYQIDLIADIEAEWQAGHQNVVAVLPTGGGKTWLASDILAREKDFTCTIAHRQELVSQWSLALNKRGVHHHILAPSTIIKWIISQHIMEHGRTFYDPNSRCVVAGVDTLTSRRDKLTAWGLRVKLWVTDEGHHLLRANKWGKAIELFPNARGLLVTATPDRPDGRGLGRHADGVADTMVIGPTGRDLINAGFLTDYRIFTGEVGFDRSALASSIGPSGEFSAPKLAAVTKGCKKIVGGIVEHYLRHAAGKIGVTFVPIVEIAGEVAAAFRQAGVPAEAVSAKTPDSVRVEMTRRLKRGDLKELVNVDLFGEGFDLPAIEVVSDAAATESYPRLVQRFGRGLRPMAGKTHAIYIDHVGNIMRHCSTRGLPDAPQVWTLDSREKRGAPRNPNAIPMRTCGTCSGMYEAFYPSCPYCGTVRVIADRSRPEFVDGDLTELDPSVLAAMRGEVARVDKDPAAVRDMMLRAGAPAAAAHGAAKQHRLRQEAQVELRAAMALWGGWQQHQGRTMAEGWKRFYWRFGVDVMTAQTLGRPEAERLAAEINGDMGR